MDWMKGLFVAAIMLLAGCPTVSAQVGPPPPGEQGKDYAKLVRPNVEIASLGNDLFGDQTDLFTGETTFVQTDIDIPGNDALPVRLARRKRPNPGSWNGPGALGDWDLDLPRLEGIFSANEGWQVSVASDYKVGTTRRCSVDPAKPELAQPPRSLGTNGVYFPSNQFWYGSSLYVPGSGTQKMMVIATGAIRPTSGGPYHWATSAGWVFSCLPSTANGVSGEGFLAYAPDGTRYYFNWFATDYEAGISATVGNFPYQNYGELGRRKVIILPTRVEDRFGNSVSYAYDPGNPKLLKSIASSDGRSIQLTYSGGLLVSASSHGRTWSYAYSSVNNFSSLKTVALPDNSAWAFEDGAPLYQNMGSWRNCADITPVQAGTATAIMRHPSGAVGTFEYGHHRHGRANVPFSCFMLYSTTYPYESKWVDTVSIVKKTLSGPGIPTPLTWTFDYGVASGSWASECPNGSCAATRTLTVTAGDGTWKRYTFSNKYNDLEGKRLRFEIGAGASAQYIEDTQYRKDAAGAYPQTGVIPCLRCDKDGEVPLPVTSRIIRQDGVNFTRQFGGFDTFARPTAISGANDATGVVRQEAVAYHDDLTKWVLSQVAKNTVNGIVAAETGFTSSAQPSYEVIFGKKVRSFTYNTDGTIASVKDGNNNTTTLGAWKRGQPQSVRNQDGSTHSIQISDSGWVSQVTDENGYATGYDYDAMGRLARVNHPAGDAVAWSPTDIAFSPVPTLEYGLPAGHWRQVVRQGNRKRITYFDAFWRPVVTQEGDEADTANTLRWSAQRYDYEGRTVFSSYPRNPNVQGWLNFDSSMPGVRTTYDALGRVTRVDQDSELGVLQSRTEYLPGGQTRLTNPRGQVTTTRYQLFDQPSYDRPTLIDSPQGVQAEIARDVFGKPTSINRTGPGS